MLHQLEHHLRDGAVVLPRPLVDGANDDRGGGRVLGRVEGAHLKLAAEEPVVVDELAELLGLDLVRGLAQVVPPAVRVGAALQAAPKEQRGERERLAEVERGVAVLGVGEIGERVVLKMSSLL